MTQNTEQVLTEFEDGAWYWVEKEWWHDEPPKIAPAMYRSDSDAWYSWEFAGISTEYLKVLEPCVRHEQAARRAPAKPQWPRFEQCQDAFDAAKNRYPQGNPLCGDHEWHWFQAGWNGRAPVVPQEGWKITEEMHVAAVKVLHRASGVDGLPQRMVDAMLTEAASCR